MRLLQLGARRGLMVARTEGARAAKGSICVVLDSHIEVGHGWLEPLLAHIVADRRRIAIPMIDSIDADSFVFSGGGLSVLGFHWGLGQQPVHGRRFNTSSAEPVPTPIMAGGLLAFDRARFFDLGAYDQEMRIYGGEEFEISFRYWQCGGSLAVTPCSHVSHVFRTDRYWQGQVYTVPGDEIARNKRRAAAVWMDEYAEVAYGQLSPLPASNPIGSLEAMLEVRRRHQCKPFKVRPPASSAPRALVGARPHSTTTPGHARRLPARRAPSLLAQRAPRRAPRSGTLRPSSLSTVCRTSGKRSFTTVRCATATCTAASTR